MSETNQPDRKPDQARQNNQPPTFFEKLGTWIRNSVTFKIISIAILILIMLIPSSMISDLIRERQYRKDDVVNEISSKWGSDQTINGPVLSVPYITYKKTEDDELKRYKAWAHFLPSELDVKGELEPHVRYRSIYEVILYSGELHLQGHFDAPDFREWKISESSVLWDEAVISMGITDMRGVNDDILLNWAGQEYSFGPGLPVEDVLYSGVSTRVQLADSGRAEHVLKEAYPFDLKINLNGSRQLNFVPLGETTEVRLSSDWKHPSFTGNFLPDEREIGKEGFSADWKVLQLNRSFPQQWLGNRYNTTNALFGVELLIGVDQYQKNMRTAKYAILIISLTFILFFFMEVINKKRIHPIQYLLVGFALSVFYVLLLSLSEQIGFSPAYLISGIAVILLISIYIHGLFKNLRLTALIGGVISMIYGFIYIILQLQDYALLMGSIGLFIVLAIVMYYTRNIDWYNVNRD